MSVFGKAKFGGGKRNWYKLKDGDSTYRILPPMGDLQEDGKWSVFYNVHYGYKNSKGEMRTFVSSQVKNRKTRMIETPDAALDRINALKAKLEEAKKTGNEELVKQLLNLVGGKKSRYNLDNNHYVNVVDLQGNIGILKIRHRAKLALDAQIKKLRDAGIEPLDPETGRFFTFTRSGMGMDTTYQVSVYKKKIHVDGIGEVEQDLIHQITDEIAKRCLVENKDGSFTYKEAARLDRLFRTPSAAEIERIVKEGEKAVDEIFDTKTESQDVGDDESGLEGEEATAPTQDSLALAVEAAKLAAQVQLAKAEAALKAATPQVTYEQKDVTTAGVVATVTTPTSAVKYEAPATPVTVTAATTPKTTAQAVAEQSDEDFLRDLGL
jgi:hypothetical protein